MMFRLMLFLAVLFHFFFAQPHFTFLYCCCWRDIFIRYALMPAVALNLHQREKVRGEDGRQQRQKEKCITAAMHLSRLHWWWIGLQAVVQLMGMRNRCQW